MVRPPLAVGGKPSPSLRLQDRHWLVTRPYLYNENLRFQRGWHRGVEASARGGLARSPVDGRILFVGKVAGRKVVTIKTDIDGILSVVTLTGLDQSTVAAGQAVNLGDPIGHASNLHIGAYDLSHRTRYFPVAALNSNVLAPREAGEGASVFAPRKAGEGASDALSRQIIKRLREAIEGQPVNDAFDRPRYLQGSTEPFIERPTGSDFAVRVKHPQAPGIGLAEVIKKDSMRVVPGRSEYFLVAESSIKNLKPMLMMPRKSIPRIDTGTDMRAKIPSWSSFLVSDSSGNKTNRLSAVKPLKQARRRAVISFIFPIWPRSRTYSAYPLSTSVIDRTNIEIKGSPEVMSVERFQELKDQAFTQSRDITSLASIIAAKVPVAAIDLKEEHRASAENRMIIGFLTAIVAAILMVRLEKSSKDCESPSVSTGTIFPALLPSDALTSTRVLRSTSDQDSVGLVLTDDYDVPNLKEPMTV